MIALDLDRAAGVIVRAEAPIIRHNTGLRGRILIRCGTTTCTLRAYRRTTNTVAVRIRLRFTPVHRRRQRVFEDYSGWVTYSRHVTLFVDTLSVTRVRIAATSKVWRSVPVDTSGAAAMTSTARDAYSRTIEAAGAAASAASSTSDCRRVTAPASPEQGAGRPRPAPAAAA